MQGEVHGPAGGKIESLQRTHRSARVIRIAELNPALPVVHDGPEDDRRPEHRVKLGHEVEVL